MVITDLVVNTVLGRVTRHPAGMHCPARDDAFVSSIILQQQLNCLSVKTLNDFIVHLSNIIQFVC